MDEQSAIKNNTNWMRCQSKSRPGQYYMFNKQTKETRWCTESSKKTQQFISGKCKSKTPAQDRLKRLQTNLEKNKNKDSGGSVAKTKDATSKNKKLDLKNSIEVPLKDKPSSSSSAKAEAPATTNSKQTVQQANHKKQTTEKSTPPKKIDQNLPVAIKEQTNAVQSNKNKFRIPKNPVNSQPENTSLKKPAKRKHNEVPSPTSSSISMERLLNQSANELPDPRKEISNGCNPKKIRMSNEFKINQEKPPSDSEKKLQCDLNDNVEPSTDQQKLTIMSVLKDYCSSLLKKVSHPNNGNKQHEATKQSNLSQNSIPSFKSKKSGPKCSLQENESRKSPQYSANATFSTKGCANDRLQRLRRSLQDQQTAINRTPHLLSSPTSIISSPSNHSVCSLNTTHSESESMDWESICEDSPLNKTTSSSNESNVSSSNLSIRSEHLDTVNENLLRLAANKNQKKHQWKTDYFYFVVDTNVFLENVTFVDELTTMKLCDTAGTLIYIPYCVLQELDKLKIRSPSESIKTRSTRAIHFINKAFEKRSENIQAQSSADEHKHLIKVTSPDDSILNCCLQVKKHIDNLMLLTEDINLRNKAMCSDILVSTKSDLISKHESLL